LQQIDYIVRTTAIGQQSALDRAALEDWSKNNRWLALEVRQVNEKLGKYHAMVEFCAHYHDGQAQQHHERSHFVRFAERWYFLDPTTTTLPSMKQNCLCGSGKKFKHCCAQYL
jgi:SEC-C motif-containing protein